MSLQTIGILFFVFIAEMLINISQVCYAEKKISVEEGESLRDTCFIPDAAFHEVGSYNITQFVQKLC